MEVIVAELGEDDNHIYHVRFDGTLRDEHGFAVIGGDEDAIRERMAEAYQPDLDLGAAMTMATTAIAESSEEDISGDAWEAAVLDANLGRRKFRRLDLEEIAAAV